MLNGVDRGGKLQTGFAVETTPFRFLMKDGLNFQEYQDNAWKRLLYNAGLSIATTKASEGSKAIRLALGLNFTLWDSAEARMIKDLASAAEKVTMETGSPDITGLRTQEAIERAYEDYYRRHGDPNGRYKEARDRILKDNKYDGSKVALSWAPVWNSPDGKASRLSPDGSSVWGTGSWKFHRNGGVITEVELLTQVRYRHNERVVDASNAALSARQDTLLLAAGLRIGDENWHAQAEAAYLRTWGGLNGNNDSMRIGGGFERRISKNLWFVLQAGNDFGAGKKSEEFYTLGSFRIGTDDTPFYTTQDLTKESKASR